MSYYFIAQIDIHDNTEYQKYLQRSEEIFSRFKGKYLAVDKAPMILEGRWDYSRTVLIRFHTKEDFLAWYNSKDYQEILQHRLKASRCDTILIEGAE